MAVELTVLPVVFKGALVGTAYIHTPSIVNKVLHVAYVQISVKVVLECRNTQKLREQ